MEPQPPLTKIHVGDIPEKERGEVMDLLSTHNGVGDTTTTILSSQNMDFFISINSTTITLSKKGKTGIIGTIISLPLCCKVKEEDPYAPNFDSLRSGSNNIKKEHKDKATIDINYVSYLCVHSDFRGKRLTPLLISSLIEDAKTKGCCNGYYLSTFPRGGSKIVIKGWFRPVNAALAAKDGFIIPVTNRNGVRQGSNMREELRYRCALPVGYSIVKHEETDKDKTLRLIGEWSSQRKIAFRPSPTLWGLLTHQMLTYIIGHNTNIIGVCVLIKIPIVVKTTERTSMVVQICYLEVAPEYQDKIGDVLMSISTVASRMSASVIYGHTIGPLYNEGCYEAFHPVTGVERCLEFYGEGITAAITTNMTGREVNLPLF